MSGYFSRCLLTILILSLLSSLFCRWFVQLVLVLMSQSIKSLNRAFDRWKGLRKVISARYWLVCFALVLSPSCEDWQTKSKNISGFNLAVGSRGLCFFADVNTP